MRYIGRWLYCVALFAMITTLVIVFKEYNFLWLLFLLALVSE